MKMPKKIVAAVITLASISSTSAMAASYVPATTTTPASNTAVNVTADATTKMTVKVRTLNVRSKPKLGKNVVGVLKKGTEVDVVKKTGSWCQITFKNKDAFVACKYLK